MGLNLLMLIPRAYSGMSEKRPLALTRTFYSTRHPFRQIFCDFGQDFQVIDTNGEAPLTQIVTEISRVGLIDADR